MRKRKRRNTKEVHALATSIVSPLMKRYTEHIKNRVGAADEAYLSTGVDKDYAEYIKLFETVFARLFDMPLDTEGKYPEYVLKDLLGVCEKALEEEGYSKKKELVPAELILELCRYTFGEIAVDVNDVTKRKNNKEMT